MHNVGVALALAPALAAVCLADNLDKYGVFTPKKIALGSTPSMDGQTYSGGFTLTSDEPLATLDYDYEVAGLPYFVVSSISNGTVDVEIKYSEQFPALSLNYSDGPSQFTTSIANSRRVGTHRFTESDSSIDVIDDLTTLPGKFSSLNAKYDEVWKLGARAVIAACLDANSQLPSWSSSEENGTFVPDTRPGISYKTWNLTNSVLNFESQIIRGGADYTIAYDLTGNRDGIQIHLASEYPSATTYANTNTTLSPPTLQP
ncbi:Glycoside hydrolase [Phytophthora cinnamomi]|uniref:Glycoside hydrolase n=1 Tax=Phytophthora cinnamomi TaxID=4785 RepID=UPI00355A4978|nr:Glycoside hydrolase [Phytophthora cinnamomi]